MKSSEIQKRYEKQKKLLLKYNHHYFNLDTPLVSDSKYDQIKSEVIKLERDFPYLKSKNSILVLFIKTSLLIKTNEAIINN